MKGASVVQRGATNLVDALEEGQVSVEAAYTLTQLSNDELDDVIARGKDAMRDKARDAERAGDWARDEAKELRRAASLAASKQTDAEAVSYTHLTLPTILRV